MIGLMFDSNKEDWTNGFVGLNWSVQLLLQPKEGLWAQTPTHWLGICLSEEAKPRIWVASTLNLDTTISKSGMMPNGDPFDERENGPSVYGKLQWSLIHFNIFLIWVIYCNAENFVALGYVACVFEILSCSMTRWLSFGGYMWYAMLGSCGWVPYAKVDENFCLLRSVWSEEFVFYVDLWFRQDCWAQGILPVVAVCCYRCKWACRDCCFPLLLLNYYSVDAKKTLFGVDLEWMICANERHRIRIFPYKPSQMWIGLRGEVLRSNERCVGSKADAWWQDARSWLTRQQGARLGLISQDEINTAMLSNADS